MPDRDTFPQTPHLSELIESSLTRAVEDTPQNMTVRKVGTVVSVGPGIVTARGLDKVMSEELLIFENNVRGLAFDIAQEHTGIILLDPLQGISSGSRVQRTGRVLNVEVGPGLMGRVLDPLGRPLDGKGNLKDVIPRPVESPAPEIMDRLPVTTPLQTGIKAVDALIPIGRGQRELILGDRQTGKTSLCLDAMINQAETGVICIYCGIGKRASAVAQVISSLHSRQIMSSTIVVSASENDPPGMQYIAPYSAMTMAEYFASRGKDVLLVLDDLTRHARAYRELSLLLRRPPGREAYPGDIFYVHSRLLERSTHLKQELGGGSITALPIIETEAENLSAYIPTNLISITDGQVYLSPILFRKGILPAVDVGKSVSRVGGKTQLPAYRTVASDLRLTYAQFEELEAFSRFGTRLDVETRNALHRGERIRAVLKQPLHSPLPVWHQIAVLAAATNGVFDPVDLDELPLAMDLAARKIQEQCWDICTRMEAGEKIQEQEMEEMVNMAAEAVEKLSPDESAGSESQG